MRRLLPLAVTVLLAHDAVIRTKVPLVVVSTAVSDKKGHSVPGLSASDFRVLDNGKLQEKQLDFTDSESAPIALAVVIQASGISDPAVKKLRKTAAVISQSGVGANGEAAVMTFTGEVEIFQDFTLDSDRLANTITGLETSPSDAGGRLIDAVDQALDLLARRSGPRRSCVLLISENRDRGSKGRLPSLLRKLQSSDVLVYGLNYSAYLTAFTTRALDYHVPETGSAGIAILGELARGAQKNAMAALTSASGGRMLSFQTRSKLEADLFGIADDLHSRYLLSFSPTSDPAPAFHKLTIQVKDRPDLVVKARAGYWPDSYGFVK